MYECLEMERFIIDANIAAIPGRGSALALMSILQVEM